MAAILRDSVVIVVVAVVVVVRTHQRAMLLAMTTKLTHGFSFLSYYEYGALLGSPWGRRSSAITSFFTKQNTQLQERYLGPVTGHASNV